MSDDYSYLRYTSKNEAHRAFNSLRGIVEGISIDKRINEKEVKELELWCEKYDYLIDRQPFNDLVTNIQVIISDNIVTHEEVEDMKWLCDKFKDGFEYFDKNTSDLQTLQGIFHGLLADGKLTDAEVIGLKDWLNNNLHLSSYYPYDEITSVLTDVLADGVIDEEERKILKRHFYEFVELTDEELNAQLGDELAELSISGVCSTDPQIKIEGSLFCFTGISNRTSRSEIARTITSLGGEFKDTIVKETNYLIVGDNGNPVWTYSCYGRKVEKAIKMRKKGNPILIIHENDFWDLVEDLG